MPFGDLFKSNCKLCKECSPKFIPMLISGQSLEELQSRMADISSMDLDSFDREIDKCIKNCQKCKESFALENVNMLNDVKEQKIRGSVEETNTLGAFDPHVMSVSKKSRTENDIENILEKAQLMVPDNLDTYYDIDRLRRLFREMSQLYKAAESKNRFVSSDYSNSLLDDIDHLIDSVFNRIDYLEETERQISEDRRRDHEERRRIEEIEARAANEDWESQQRRKTTPRKKGKKGEEELDPVELAAANLKWANDWNDAPDPSAAAAAPREESRLLEPWAYAIVERWNTEKRSQLLKDKLFEEYRRNSPNATMNNLEHLLKVYGS